MHSIHMHVMHCFQSNLFNMYLIVSIVIFYYDDINTRRRRHRSESFSLSNTPRRMCNVDCI